MNEKGSTLLELLIAITILAIVTVPMHKSITSALAINYDSQDHVKANLVAQEEIEAFKSESINAFTPNHNFETTNTYEATKTVNNYKIKNKITRVSQTETPNTIDNNFNEFFDEADITGYIDFDEANGNSAIYLRNTDGSVMNLTQASFPFEIKLLNTGKTSEGIDNVTLVFPNGLEEDNAHAQKGGNDLIFHQQNKNDDNIQVAPKWFLEVYAEPHTNMKLKLEDSDSTNFIYILIELRNLLEEEEDDGTEANKTELYEITVEVYDQNDDVNSDKPIKSLSTTAIKK